MQIGNITFADMKSTILCIFYICLSLHFEYRAAPNTKKIIGVQLAKSIMYTLLKYKIGTHCSSYCILVDEWRKKTKGEHLKKCENVWLPVAMLPSGRCTFKWPRPFFSCFCPALRLVAKMTSRCYVDGNVAWTCNVNYFDLEHRLNFCYARRSCLWS